MTNLEITLSVLLYTVMMFVMYKPFKLISKNKWTVFPKIQIVLFPVTCIILLIFAMILGLNYMLKNKCK